MKKRLNRRKLIEQSNSRENHFEKKMKYKSRTRELIKSFSSSKKNRMKNSQKKNLPESYHEALKIYSKEANSSLLDQSVQFYRGIKFNKRTSSSKKKVLKNIICYQNMNLFRDDGKKLTFEIDDEKENKKQYFFVFLIVK